MHFIVAALVAAGAPQGLLAVLELQSKLKPADRELIDAGYFANRVRSAALDTLPGLRLMTRENMVSLLEASGKKLEECEGECEVETGRRLGADWVISGEVIKLGATYRLDLRIHDTHEGRMLAGAQASGKEPEALDAAVAVAVRKLLLPLGAAVPAGAQRAPAEPAPLPAPVQEAAPPPAPSAQRPRLADLQDPFTDQNWTGKHVLLGSDLFGVGNATLKASSESVLARLAAWLQEHPGAVSIEVHSDNLGSASLNQQLTDQRAAALKQVLTQKGVEAERLTARGFGGDKPIDTNGSAQGRARNRRVEIWIGQ